MARAHPGPTATPVTTTPSTGLHHPPGRVLRPFAPTGPQAHLLSHAPTAGSPESTACRTSRTFSSSQLTVAGSFQRKCDLPRYRLTSWLRAGGWLWETGAHELGPPGYGLHTPTSPGGRRRGLSSSLGVEQVAQKGC